VWCSVLQCLPECCRVFVHSGAWFDSSTACWTLKVCILNVCVAACCSVLCCSLFQCVAVYCSVPAGRWWDIPEIHIFVVVCGVGVCESASECVAVCCSKLRCFYTSMCICVCVCMFICVCVCVCVRMWIHIHTHINRNTTPRYLVDMSDISLIWYDCVHTHLTHVIWLCAYAVSHVCTCL